MSFFGLTYLGSGNVFQNTRANKLERVMAIPEERFVRIFQAMSLEATRPSLATCPGSANTPVPTLSAMISAVAADNPRPVGSARDATGFSSRLSSMPHAEFRDRIQSS